jgi:hypothetical protein
MSRKLICLISLVLVLGLVSDTSAELVAQWKLDEGAGTTAVDATGNGHDGELIGNPEWVTGYYVGGLKFAGSPDKVDIPHSADLNPENEFTVSVWANLDPGGSGHRSPITSRDDYPQRGYILYCTPENTWQFWTGNAAGGWDNAGSPPVTLGEWTHVAGTYSNGEKKLYINGELAGESNAAMPPNTEQVLRIGSGATEGEGNYFFVGMIDDVRLYDHVLTDGDIQASMLNQGGAMPKAYGPDPRSGTLHEDTWISLGWRAGDFAVSHDVYLGETFDAVNEGAEETFVGNQAATFIVAGFPGYPYPDGLIPGTTYYWRIDEVNDAEPNSPWKGDIWSFSIPPKTAYFPDPADSAESVEVDVTLGWTPGFGAKLHTIYFGENFDEVESAAGGLPQGTGTYSPGTLKMAKTYYWRVDEFDVVETYKGDVWSFTTEGAVAALDPVNGTVDVTQTPVLTWAPGLGASYEVYFGADAASLELKASGNLGSESYDPGQLEWNTTYYWRVDEANSANADSPWTGPLWSFTTANFLIIDDMEAYNDINEGEEGSNRIYNAWVDGFEDPTNGSQTGHLDAPFYEETIVHGGNKSMPLYYDNAVGKSEATSVLTSNRDWTVNGVDTLTIWFRGESSNAAEILYVALNGSAVVNNGNPDAATITRWTQWNIDLTRFADQGVNLSNVDSITLGLSSVTGGTGMMYFDDIRLYAQ